MTRTLAVAAVLIGLAITLPLASAAVPAAPLNVLFITADDMNWDSVGAFGCPVEGITPNLDRLASEGMRFEHGHVTIAICQPTRAVWMTGRYPHRSGALGFDPIDAGVPTLLETLHEAGYFTGIMAKVPHVVPTRRASWDVIVEASELNVGRNPHLFHQRSREFFAQAKQSGKPFFLMANTQDPHRPFAGSAAERGRRKTGANAPPTKRRRGFPGVSRTFTSKEIVVPPFLPDLPDVRKEVAQYFTSVHRADEAVGAVLKALRQEGLDDETLVMFVSDHGMAFPFAKTNCWLHSTRTPWIVRYPGMVEPGSVDRTHFISGIDFAPTILAAVGLPSIEGVDGRSFLPVLLGQEQAGRERVFTHINRTAGRKEYPMRAVQDAQFGYIFNAWSDGETIFRNESQSGLTMKAMIAAAGSDPQIAARVKHFLYRTTEELYDYQADPAALNNLADDPDYREQLNRCRRLMRGHLRATDDPVLAAFQEKVKIE